MFDDVQSLGELVVGDDERHEGANHVAESSGADEEESRFVGARQMTRSVRSLSGSLGGPVANDLEGPHGAEPPRVADEREALERISGSGLDRAADRRGALERGDALR